MSLDVKFNDVRRLGWIFNVQNRDNIPLDVPRVGLIRGTLECAPKSGCNELLIERMSQNDQLSSRVGDEERGSLNGVGKGQPVYTRHDLVCNLRGHLIDPISPRLTPCIVDYVR